LNFCVTYQIFTKNKEMFSLQNNVCFAQFD